MAKKTGSEAVCSLESRALHQMDVETDAHHHDHACSFHNLLVS